AGASDACRRGARMVGRVFNRESGGGIPRMTARRPQFQLSPSTKRMLIAAAVIVGIIAIAVITASFWVNWLWFGSMGYRGVLVRRYGAQILSFLVVGGISALIFYVNVILALRNTSEKGGTAGTISRWSKRLLRALFVGIALIIFIITGVAGASHWEDNMLALRGPSFGVTDPTFNREHGFYVVMLPVLKGRQGGLVLLVIVTTLAVAVVYLVRLGVRFRSWGDVPWAALRHISGLIAVVLFLLAFGYLLRNYD